MSADRPRPPLTPEELERRRRRRAAPSGPGTAGRARGLTRLALLAAALALIAGVVLAVRSRSHSRPVPALPAVARIVIPEGETRAQIAQIAAREGLKGSYLAVSRSSAALDASSYGAPASIPDLEGFLFPATYELYEGEPAARLVEEQLQAFGEKVGHAYDGDARRLGLTSYQLLTVASMIEREARVPGDRAKIAAVIYNRLRAGMALGIDATIDYAVELQKGIPVLGRELTAAELQIDSPYNTRTHTGLPPTPIANPGLASIYAAAHPAHVPYLYYVEAADGCGEQAFSVTAAEFEADAAAYRAAVARNGGQPPRCTHR